MSPTDLRCYTCDAEPGEPCRSHVTGEALSVTHYNRASAAWAASSSSLLPGADVSSPCPYCLAQAGERCVSGIDGSPVGYVHTERMRRDTEPCPAPAAEEPVRPICACGQTIWRAGDGECADCTQMRWTSGDHDDPVSLDARIREAQTPDRIHCAWSTPTGEGEAWR